MKNAGVARPNQSLFLFQALTHTREDVASHLKEIGEHLKHIMVRDMATMDIGSKRLMKDLATYLEEELEYHGDMFVDKEFQEPLSEVLMSRERLRKAQKMLEIKKPPVFASQAAQPLLPLQDAA